MAEYIKTEWVNGAAPGISAQQLNRMEQGIYDAHYPNGALLHATVAQIITGILPEKINFNWLGGLAGLWNSTEKQLELVGGVYLFELQVYCDDPAEIQKIAMQQSFQGSNAHWFNIIGPLSDKYARISGFINVIPMPPGATLQIWPEITASAGVQISGQAGATFLHVVKIKD
jgi:hypothetical protein